MTDRPPTPPPASRPAPQPAQWIGPAQWMRDEAAQFERLERRRERRAILQICALLLAAIALGGWGLAQVMLAEAEAAAPTSAPAAPAAAPAAGTAR